jgi:hypothetical protein
MAEDRLYGTPGAEWLHGSPYDVWESEIDPLRDGDDTEWVIEEWASTGADDRIMGGRVIVEHVMEHLCDEMVEGGDAWVNVTEDGAVIAAAEALSALIARRVTYRWAEKKVAEHTITLDPDDEPLLDGEPWSVPARTQEERHG